MDYPVPARSEPGQREQARYLALAVGVGVLAGAIGSVFHLVINALLDWPAHLRAAVDGPMLVVVAALITMAVTVGVVALVRHTAPEAGGSGVQEVEGAMGGLRDIHWTRVLPLKFFAGAAAIGSGLVLGREGPTIHIGASVAAMFAERFGLDATERSGLLAAGAAAGLACAFNAPVAGVLFVIEETRRQFPYRSSTYMGVIIAAVLATVMTRLIGGLGPDLSLPAPATPLALLPLFVLLGCLLGWVGVVLNAAILGALAFAGAAQARTPYLYPAAVGLVVGALLALIPVLVREQPGVVALLLLALVRFGTTVGSYSTGVPGGIFAPILSLAGCVGVAFAALVSALAPHWGVMPAAFAIAAMGGLFTASVRAPLVGVVLTLELTGAYEVTLPLLTTCLSANLVAQWLGGKPIYAQLLERTLTMAGINAIARPANDK
jgi:CIC family chloride channel protein